MTLDACAAIVERGDPDRWRALLAAPVEVRATLLPLYAFNLEVARAPWLTQEPLIAEMRLQWWADVLDEIVGGHAVRRHEVTTPLSDVLLAPTAERLKILVEARRRDIHREAFATLEEAGAYIADTAGVLAQVALLSLGADVRQAEDLSPVASAGGLARLLQATPELERRGWRLWRATIGEERLDLIRMTHADYRKARGQQRSLSKPQRAALLPDWQAGALLSLAMTEPERIEGGSLALSPFRDRLLLLRATVSGGV